MPLKEIAVSAVAPDQGAVTMEKLGLCNHGDDQDMAKNMGDAHKPAAKTNSAFAVDPTDAASSVDALQTNKESQTLSSKDLQTAMLFTASSERKDADCTSSELGTAVQSTSRAGMLSRHSSTQSSVSTVSSQPDICRICHCEGDEESPLVTPCLCLGSLQHVHQACIQQWIKSSNTKSCELCRFPFVMQTKLKPVGKWEKLDMSSSERRKIICSVSFHVVAITCVVWALYVLIDRTTIELNSGGITEWPFWTKLVVVAIGFTGGLVFMYVQCKVYLQLWRRLKAYNRVIYVQNCPPEERLKVKQAKTVPEPPQSLIQIIN